MPTYDYQCRNCGAVTEVIHSMLEDGPSVCERCGGALRRILYPTGIIFKGSGFYSTDSRSSSSSASSGSGKSDTETAAKPVTPSSDGASTPGGNGSSADKPSTKSTSSGDSS